MKKIYMAVIALAALIVNNKANAQKGFSFGVKATPQFSFLQNSDDNDNSRLDKKATFNAAFGVGSTYNFTGRSGVGLDVLYSLQGQRYKTNGIETHQKLNYVKIPLYYTYTAAPSKLVSFTGKIGPQVSILSSSKLKDGNGNEIKSDTKDYYKDATFGGMAAAGVQFQVSRNMYITTMGRFDYDFTNAEDHNTSYWPVGRAKTYNMTSGLEVGFKYMLR